MTLHSFLNYHSTMEEFTCAQCPKSFQHKFHLNRHMLNHGERKYDCSDCDIKFSRSDFLRRHQKICKQRKKMDNVCDVCNKALSNKYNMIAHRKKCEIRHRVMKMKKKSEEYMQMLKDLNLAKADVITNTC